MLIFSILFLLGTVNAEDANSTVPLTNDSFESIQNLINNANPGDSIYLENKTYQSCQ